MKNKVYSNSNSNDSIKLPDNASNTVVYDDRQRRILAYNKLKNDLIDLIIEDEEYNDDNNSNNSSSSSID